MGWGHKRHPLETLAVALAVAIFAGGIGVATWIALGQVAIAAGAALAAGLVAWAILERAGGSSTAAASSFAPSGFEGSDEMLTAELEQSASDELLLDDPLPPPGEKSRVVSLFAQSSVNSTPGELVDRIGDYLGQRDAAPTLAGPPVQPAPDASAELYAALANIRASLR